MPVAYGRAFTAAGARAPPRARRRRCARGRLDRAGPTDGSRAPSSSSPTAPGSWRPRRRRWRCSGSTSTPPPRTRTRRHRDRGVHRARPLRPPRVAGRPRRRDRDHHRAHSTASSRSTSSSRARTERYRRPPIDPRDRDVQVLVDLEASGIATVVEVHAPDDVGLLARVAAVFVDLELDVDAGDRLHRRRPGRRRVLPARRRRADGSRTATRSSPPGHALSRLTAAVTLDERSPAPVAPRAGS